MAEHKFNQNNSIQSSHPPRVIVGATHWTLNGVNIFSANLVRGLREKGMAAHILLTEENSKLVSINEKCMERPTDIPFVNLPIDYWRHTWGGQWGALIRYLEEMAPCIYIPNYDWRHSCVAPLLSDDIGIIGIVHSDDPLHYDHVKRQGRYWNAITAVSTLVAEKTIMIDPDFQEKLSTVFIGVDIPSDFPEKKNNLKRPLKLIYHGTLKQHQKRIFDIPAIISKLVSLNIPVELTIAGSGPDEDRLKSISSELIKQGLIKFTGIVPHDKILTLLEQHDIYILTSEFEGMPNALLEAMGRRCIPIVTDIDSSIPDLVKNGENGYVVKIGALNEFAERIKSFHNNPEKRQRMSERAFETVSTGNYQISHMIQSYYNLIKTTLKEIETGGYRRPQGLLIPPPKQVAGVEILPVDLNKKKEGIGFFPSDFPDFKHFQFFIEQLKNRNSPLFHLSAIETARKTDDYINKLKGVKIIVSTPAWTKNGVNDFTEALVRDFSGHGIQTEILLTEEKTNLVDISDPLMPKPQDINFKYLPCHRNKSWRAQWGAMVQYLNKSAPCIYIPNYDWRHSCVSPLLSDDVAVVGIVHEDHELYYNHIADMGTHWNAIIAVNHNIAKKVISINPAFEQKTSVILSGLNMSDRSPLKTIQPETPLTFICTNIKNRNELERFNDIIELLNEKLNNPEFTILCSSELENKLVTSLMDSKKHITIKPLQTTSQNMLLTLYEHNDFILLLEKFNTTWKMMYEAMGKGCIPIISDTAQMNEITGDIIQNNYNGFKVPANDIQLLIDSLMHIQQNIKHRQTLSTNAYNSAIANTYRIDKDIFKDYLALFANVFDDTRSGYFKRKRDFLYPLLKKVNGILVFPKISNIIQRFILLFYKKN